MRNGNKMVIFLHSKKGYTTPRLPQGFTKIIQRFCKLRKGEIITRFHNEKRARLYRDYTEILNKYYTKIILRFKKGNNTITTRVLYK